MRYSTLSPGNIGALLLPNRIVLPAMVVNYCTDTGAVSPRFLRYHVERARGGAGLLITEATMLRPDGRGFPRQLSIQDDTYIPGLRRLTQAVHEQGARMAVQLYHPGRQTSHALTGHPLLGPSETHFNGESTKAMTAEDISSVINSFAAAARRAREAGFDAVELHAAHGYLLQQFLSRFTNKRTDAWGGTLENRALFTRQVIAAVRKAVGQDFPLILRLSVEEPVPNGLTLEEGIEAARLFAAAGVDALHISAGLREAGMWVTPPQSLPLGIHASRAEAVRTALGGRVPVIAVGRIHSLAQADSLLHRGVADFIAMGRALLADPYLPRKAAAGEEARIRPCLACNEGCIGQLGRGQDVACAINPLLGREHEDIPAPSAQPSHVVVVGGGPAGLVAACTARTRGHRVTLLEKADHLGGRLMVAALPPHKSALRHYGLYLTNLAHVLGVDIRLGVESDAATVAELQPDHVIVAVGGVPRIPHIIGLDKCHYRTAEDVLLTAGAEIVSPLIVVGGGLVGCETAEFLSAHGHTVTVVELREGMALEMEPRSRMLLLQRLEALAVTLLPGTQLVSVAPDHVHVKNAAGPACLPCPGTLVLATGYLTHDKLACALRKKGIPVREAGDCAAAGGILEAVHAAFDHACSL